MTGERLNSSCPYCESSDVFRTDGDLFECERCGLRTSEAREAKVGRGAAIYLSDVQLEALGVDTDADQVRYSVKNGSLAIEGVSLDG